MASFRDPIGGSFDPFDRMAKNLTGQNATPPRSPMGATAEDLRRGPMGAPTSAGSGASFRSTSPLGAADSAMYDASPEGRSTARAYNQAKADAAGVGSKASRPSAPTSAGPAKAPKIPTLKGKIAGVPGPLGTAISAGLEGYDVYRTAASPNSTTSDIVQQTGEGAARVASAGLGAIGGAKVGGALGALGGPLAPFTVPAGALLGGAAGGALGYFGAGEAMEAGREMVGVDPRSAVDRVTALPVSPPSLRNPNQTAQTAQRTGLTLSSGGAGRGNTNPTLGGVLEAEDMRDPSGTTNAQIAARNPAGRVTKAGNSYSGSNVSGEVSFQGRDGNTLRGQPGGGFMVADAMPQAEINATLTNPDGSRWSSNDNAIMAANLRDGVDPYRGTSRGTVGQGGGMSATGGLFDTPKARRAAQALSLTEQDMRMSNAATLRGQDVTLRGQDMELEGRLAPARAAAAGRERVASYLRGPQGKTIDPAVGYRTALAAGDTDAAESIAKLMDMDDARATKRNSAVDELLKPLSTFQGEDGKPGGVDDGLLQQNRAILEGFATSQNKTVDQLLADGPSVRAAIQAINGMNSVKDTGVGQMIGWDKPSTLRRQMPDLTGATSEDVGFIEGLLTPQASRGDRKINLANGEVVHLPQGTMSDQEVQNFLRGRGLDK